MQLSIRLTYILLSAKTEFTIWKPTTIRILDGKGNLGVMLRAELALRELGKAELFYVYKAHYKACQTHHGLMFFLCSR